MPYSVGDTAKRSGFTIETLRYYERINLVTNVPRDHVGRRVYGDEHLSWLGMLRCLRDTGMPIQRMCEYAELSRQPSAAVELLDLLQEYAAEVDARIAAMQHQRAYLDTKIAYYQQQLG